MARIRIKAVTHVGKVRVNNEDFHHVDPDLNLIIVADGVGGRPYGEVASKLAVESCYHYLSEENPPDLSGDYDFTKETGNAIKYANEKVIALQNNEPIFKNMGTTLSCLAIHQDQACFSYVGDSRIYLLRPQTSELLPLTKDHTMDKSKIDKELAPDLYKRASSILTRMVGSFLLLSPDSGSVELQDGDILLACTDGLSDMVKDEFLLEYAIKCAGDLEALAAKLLDRALDCGGRDNITFALAHYQH